MADFPPSNVDPDPGEDRDPRVVGVDSEDADELVAALSSETGRHILSTLYDEPATPAELADRVDTTLQNVQYHLGKLETGNLVEVVDTAYSEKGREMKVYAPAAQPLVLFAGNESETLGLKSALTNLLGGVGVLALASLLVQRFAWGGTLGGSDGYELVDWQGADDGGDGGGDAGGTSVDDRYATGATDEGVTADAGATTDPGGAVTDDAADATSTAADGVSTSTEPLETTAGMTTDAATTVTDGVAATGVPPGLLFFAGGALVLALGFALWYARTR